MGETSLKKKSEEDLAELAKSLSESEQTLNESDEVVEDSSQWKCNLDQVLDATTSPSKKKRKNMHSQAVTIASGPVAGTRDNAKKGNPPTRL